ncbi:penicillin acylase family protein [Pseudoroseomonas rhizosphaerae]|uniref:Penicillin acylase family protein n=1 Tax=Teichococcus rhizosphaerae TaxID=1335062 RepID=A0A2C6ZEF0_9PROT|nr:penicillin acylase family protein [Pseudoroseomonas rhizosphaerae]PHK96841.1 penicillin acylase family protein [Pseudoroseomonas rhizosphaerae]
MQRRPGRLRRFFRRGLIAAALILVLAGLGAGGLLWASLPPREGRIGLPGLSAAVEVVEDAHGIPRITAQTELDAARALGWLHARDRMFQMELMRRNASGRLAEIAGRVALRLDRFHRTLGLRQRAEADLAALPPGTRAMLEAYAEGVNAWIAARGRLAAPEFIALGVPEPWQPADSLLWAKTMGLWLSNNWRTEIDRARLAGLLPPERLAELWPADETPGRPDGQPDRRAALEPERMARLAAALPRFPQDAPLPSIASNAWALAPDRSASGGALLASDPHLGFQAPILWYLARIELPGGRFLAGATAPGVPFMVIGRNERLAWGFTTTHSDTQDVFVERLSGADGYETPEGPRPFTLREESIAIRGEEPQRLRVRETRHGPVVSDLEGPGLEGDLPPGTVLAVRMANLEPGDSAAAGLHALNRATSLAMARAAAARITAPPQNLMVADAAGGIGMYLTGRVPLRRAGDGGQPAPGWDGSHDWDGFVPFDALPHAEAPASGVLVNANNRVQPEGDGPYLGRDWHGDWRFRRIHALLAQRGRHTPQDQAVIQQDAVSLFAREVLPVLLSLPRPAGHAGAARDLLLGWEGEMAPDRPQPLIFNAWWKLAARMALAHGGVPEGGWPATSEFLRFVLHPDGRGAHWCRPAAEAGTPRPASAFAPGGACAALAAAALTEAVEELVARFGPDPAAWRWGDAHAAQLEHPLLRFVPLLGRWSSLSLPTPGDGETVNRGGTDRSFRHVHGPGLRAVFDLASPDGAWAVIATGQSGHPLSRHWGDQAALWAGRAADGARLLRLGAVPEQAGGQLTLAPADSSAGSPSGSPSGLQTDAGRE